MTKTRAKGQGFGLLLPVDSTTIGHSKRRRVAAATTCVVEKSRDAGGVGREACAPW